MKGAETIESAEQQKDESGLGSIASSPQPTLPRRALIPKVSFPALKTPLFRDLQMPIGQVRASVISTWNLQVGGTLLYVTSFIRNMDTTLGTR